MPSGPHPHALGHGAGDGDVGYFVIQVDADNAAGANPAVFGQGGLLHQAAPRRHQQIVRLIKGADRDQAGDLLFRLERQHSHH